MLYENHYVLIKMLHVILGKRDSKFVCTRCLSTYSNQNVLLRLKQKCKRQKATAIKTSNDSLMWKMYFRRNLI